MTADNTELFVPQFQLLCLTEEEDINEDYQYDDEVYWIDDCECEDNLGCNLLTLIPEECIVDKENHIQHLEDFHLFFEELGYISEEPLPIDPTRDYDEEARILIEERNKTRKQHVEFSVPSLDHTHSNITSNSSSFHQFDLRQLHYQHKPVTYNYSSYNQIHHPLK